MKSQETTTGGDVVGRTPRGVGLYLLLFMAQFAGAVMLLGNLIPLYRLMALDFANFKPDPEVWWAVVGMLLILVAYWLRVKLKPAMPQIRSIVAGHIAAFVARLTFVAVTAAFADMFLKRFDALKDLDYPPLRALAVLLMFFTIFCWTLELENLAKLLQAGNDENIETNRN